MIYIAFDSIRVSVFFFFYHLKKLAFLNLVDIEDFFYKFFLVTIYSFVFQWPFKFQNSKLIILSIQIYICIFLGM